MKKTAVLLTFFLLASFVAMSQGLNSSASYIRTNHEKEYNSTIRKYAVDKWENDFSMVVYEINRQSESLFELISKFESEHTGIAYSAIIKWSIRGYETHNRNKWDEIEIFGLKQLLGFHCDWAMVLYEYDRQVEAKISF